MTITVPAGQDMMTPLGAYNFHVSFELGLFENIAAVSGEDKKLGHDKEAIVGGFSDVSGLEASMEPKTFRSGGDNYRVHQRVGQVSFSPIVLKRGLVLSRHLWGWFSLFAGANHPANGDNAANGNWNASSRADVSIVLLQNRKPVVGWKVERAMPVKFRVGDLNASGGELAVEELHLAHEGFHVLAGDDLSAPAPDGDATPAEATA
ncbi:phage tail protein [Parerythrobacter jejuensis]|uniref:Phage tail protein n=1 Tax=Parerythrobacter jejuensis TaxID=795812 RepID=A0A845AUK0_9SPHN|nr:phage tail protein [Parerythrobacter jejuensis]MXP31270.1 phage tail protein [Parerythrobacter jejuensis]MXP34030.1 phage tail protein [Parerythrobacter jejuensis]